MLQDSRCKVLSPDGQYLCQLLAGHHLNGNPVCKNPPRAEWCGYCSQWECVLHGVKGGKVEESLSRD